MRRAFLCGEDKQTGQSYEHRRGWVAYKIKTRSQTFAIDVAAYAVMSNHYHIALRVDQALAEGWNSMEVIKKQSELFNQSVTILRLYGY